MGYVRQQKIYKLVFADPDYEGLEVRARSVDIDTFLEIAELADQADQEPAAMRKLLDGFAGVLVDWNLEEPAPTKTDPGRQRPVPATRAGLGKQDPEFAIAIVLAWMDAVGDISAPKLPSSNGGPLLESIPMAVTGSPST